MVLVRATEQKNPPVASLSCQSPLQAVAIPSTISATHKQRSAFMRNVASSSAPFFRLGQFQARHSQPGIQRELQLSVGIDV